eukprot:SM000095S24999  [mRNA]  locus=s95:467682:471395:+ [translate_table: standard]
MVFGRDFGGKTIKARGGGGDAASGGAAPQEPAQEAAAKARPAGASMAARGGLLERLRLHAAERPLATTGGGRQRGAAGDLPSDDGRRQDSSAVEEPSSSPPPLPGRRRTAAAPEPARSGLTVRSAEEPPQSVVSAPQGAVEERGSGHREAKAGVQPPAEALSGSSPPAWQGSSGERSAERSARVPWRPDLAAMQAEEGGEDDEHAAQSASDFEGIIELDDKGGSSGRGGAGASRRREVATTSSRAELLDSLRRQAAGLPVAGERATGTGGATGNEREGKLPVSPRGQDGPQAGQAPRPRVVNAGEQRTNFDAALADDFFSVKTFRQVGASEEMVAALASLGIHRPSHIQAMAMKPILNRRDCIVADQTGTGKTLAYLAPLMQHLRQEEAASGARAAPGRPHAIVLVPTTELAAQVLKVCRDLRSGGMALRAIAVTGGHPWRTQVDSLKQGAELVVATPGRLLKHLESGSVVLEDVKRQAKPVVFDEADIMFDDETFAETIAPIKAALPSGSGTQYVHVTATMPVDVHNALMEQLPGAVLLMGPSLHRTSLGLQEGSLAWQVLVDCSSNNEEHTPESAFLRKRDALLQLVDQKKVPKTIIFCNKIETCRDVENALARHDRQGKAYDVLPYHAALTPEKRQQSLRAFLGASPSQRLFLVCTDRASRGVDSADVEHVVLFDFPRDPSEYVRRVGRTARGAGGTGKVFVFALGKQVSLARHIMSKNEKGQPIHTVPGSGY